MQTQIIKFWFTLIVLLNNFMGVGQNGNIVESSKRGQQVIYTTYANFKAVADAGKLKVGAIYNFNYRETNLSQIPNQYYQSPLQNINIVPRNSNEYTHYGFVVNDYGVSPYNSAGNHEIEYIIDPTKTAISGYEGEIIAVDDYRNNLHFNFNYMRIQIDSYFDPVNLVWVYNNAPYYYDAGLGKNVVGTAGTPWASQFQYVIEYQNYYEQFENNTVYFKGFRHIDGNRIYINALRESKVIFNGSRLGNFAFDKSDVSGNFEIQSLNYNSVSIRKSILKEGTITVNELINIDNSIIQELLINSGESVNIVNSNLQECNLVTDVTDVQNSTIRKTTFNQGLSNSSSITITNSTIFESIYEQIFSDLLISNSNITGSTFKSEIVTINSSTINNSLFFDFIESLNIESSNIVNSEFWQDGQITIEYCTMNHFKPSISVTDTSIKKYSSCTLINEYPSYLPTVLTGGKNLEFVGVNSINGIKEITCEWDGTRFLSWVKPNERVWHVEMVCKAGYASVNTNVVFQLDALTNSNAVTTGTTRYEWFLPETFKNTSATDLKMLFVQPNANIDPTKVKLIIYVC